MDEPKLITINKLVFFPIFCLIIAVLSSGFYERDLWFADEPREAGIAARMVDEGTYAVPKLGSNYFVEKPPLYYWASSALILLNDNRLSISDILRLGSVFWGIGILLLTYWLGHIWAKQIKAVSPLHDVTSIPFLAVILLAACNGFLTNALTIRTDIVLTFFIVLTTIGFCESYLNKKAWGSWLVGLGLAGGFLAKGIIGIVLSGFIWLALLPFFIQLWRDRSSSLLFIKQYICFSLLLCVIPAGIWIYALINQGGDAAWNMWFVQNTLKRFTGGGHLGHEESNLLFYVEPFLTYTLPWGFIWIVLLLINYKVICTDKIMRSLQLCTILPLIFLCIATTKRAVYLLPLLPLFALSFTFLWATFQNDKWLNYGLKAFSYVFLILIISIAILSCLPSPILPTEFASLYNKIAFISPWVAACLLISVLFYFFYFNNKPMLQLSQILLFVVLIANLIVFPKQNPENSRHEQQAQLKEKSAAQWAATQDEGLTEGLQGYLYTYHKYIP